MLHLRTLNGKMLVLFRDAVTAIEETEVTVMDGGVKLLKYTTVYCGNIVHKVIEDFETVYDMMTVKTDYDMMTGQPEDTDDNGTPVLTPPLENADPGPATGGNSAVNLLKNVANPRAYEFTEADVAKGLDALDPGPAKGGNNEN